MQPIWRAVPFLILFATSTFARAESNVIFDMDQVVHQPGEVTVDGKKVPAGSAELVDGKFGKAVRFSFVENARGGFMTARVRPTEAWDQAEGFSFWVKGDGSSHWGGIELIDRDDFSLRYGYCFPINSTEWRKVVVPWSDLTPELTGPLVDVNKGYAPSHFGNFWFGKWFYWRDYPAISYAIDQVQLEKSIDVPVKTIAAQGTSPLSRFRDKLVHHQPVTIVTMGDSLSDKRHWSNQKALWSELLASQLKAKYGSDVTLINPAVGGTSLSQNIVTMPVWSTQAPAPDLVTIWFGGNDWETGVRGQRFAEYLRLAVDRIRRQTGGSADILILTTLPSHDRWETMRELEQAARDVAREKNTALVDIASEFRKAGSADQALAKDDWAWDKTHLGKAGHELTARMILSAIAPD
jgi:lysophospholipase L1-like esterase